MSEFDEAAAAWRLSPLPPGSTCDQIDELHADLALADTWVAEAVIPYIERGLHRIPEVDVIERLSELRARAIGLGESSKSPENEQLTDSYRDYIDLLLRVYRAYMDLGTSNS